VSEYPGPGSISKGAWHLTGLVALLLAAIPARAAPTTSAHVEIALEAYARPGTLVRLATGRSLNIRCIGSGSPTVILTAGAGEQSLTWRSLQGELAKTMRVCAWDRAGFGFSDPSPATQDTAHTTDDLEAVLKGSKTPPPYVLVGHSLGSYETLLFTFRHPGEVTGIVLIDPSAPFQGERMRRAAPAAYAAIDALQQKQTADLETCIRLLEQSVSNPKCLRPPIPGYPASLNAVLTEKEGNVEAQKNFLSLLESVFTDKDSQELQDSWKALGAIPLIVLTAGEPPPIPLDGAAKPQMTNLLTEWSRMHGEIAALSGRGVNRVVPGATHYIYLQRQAVVADAVREVLSVARAERD